MNIIIPRALEQIGGCITLNDESMFGIRCNHLMWAEGWLEGAENNHAILEYGNHKGVLEIVLLTIAEHEWIQRPSSVWSHKRDKHSRT